MSAAFSVCLACLRRGLERCLLPLGLSFLAVLGGVGSASAQETVCARVKIEIKQELTLERQAFDAEMRIINTLEGLSLSDVAVVVKITDEAGIPVAVTNDPNNLSAKFYLRVSGMQNISDISGSGTVLPATTSSINWLLIPAPGAAGNFPQGKKYLVGATLSYKFAGEAHTLDVEPDVITVKPLPLLTLDYFLTQDVVADDPMTPEIEPTEPFTLGVRVKNTGMATAKSLKIDSAQPKIIENKQDLLINFKLNGSYVNDAPVQNTLLADLGDIPGGNSKMARWVMETSLAGKFVEFSARFSHADELGGMLTSILQETNAHFLLRDVRVDLPGRDYVRDFLAKDGDAIRVFESDSVEGTVTDLSSVARLEVGSASGSQAQYRLSMPATMGFVYVKLPDPHAGTKALGRMVRADGKEVLPENVWLWKTRNGETKKWDYWVSLFDVNTPGVYDAEFQAPPAAAKPPAIQFIPDRVVKEGQQVSFLVEASSPDGRAVLLSAAPLPAGASFVPQGADPKAPATARGVFDWTPAKGTAGHYLIVYSATDGTLTSSRSATIRVESNEPPPGPGTPSIDGPLAGALVTTLKPLLRVQTSTVDKDPTLKVQFEIYADEAMSQLVDSGLVDKALQTGGTAVPTTWQGAGDLNDNTRYWWRARAFDGATIYSPWANGRFFVNLYNDAPDSFNLASPAANAEVSTLLPVLAWTNAVDRDGDVVTYTVDVYRDGERTQRVGGAADLAAGSSGSTSWTMDVPLENHQTYYWLVRAKDSFDATTPSLLRSFTVNTGNTPPTDPVLLAPAPGGQSTNPATPLTISNSHDAEADLITYVFEIDTVNTFDSGDKRSSGQVIQGSGQTTSWVSAGLVENKRYYWRVKAQDGRAESAWVLGNFLMNAVNEAPPVPTVSNPGNGAWSATQQPTLQAHPVLDPEGEAVRYQFEIYRDAGLTSKVADGSSFTPGWVASIPLRDKTTHWWRVRAVDPQNNASPWSLPAVLYVSTAPYQNPSIQLTAPAVPTMPDTVKVGNGIQRQVTLRWEGNDPNIEPTVALYYSTVPGSYAGTLIVDGLRQTAGAQGGTHVWDVTALPPGAYYVYAVIYDAKGLGRAYAPGAVVVPASPQSGKIVVTAKDLMRTDEAGGTAKFVVRLGKAPTADVVLPLSSTRPSEGAASPASLTFTPKNWSVNQTVTVTGQNDCAPDRLQRYQILSGKAQSVDPNYIGLSGMPVEVMNLDNLDWRRTTDSGSIYICGMSIANQRKIDVRTWEYTLKAQLTNVGNSLRGVVARLDQVPLGMQKSDAQLEFGAVASGETVKSSGTVTLRSRIPLPEEFFRLGLGFRWKVTLQP